MTIEDLYTSIQMKNVPNNLIIFKSGKDKVKFLAYQYATEIANLREIKKSILYDLENLSNNTVLSELTEPTLQIYDCEQFSYPNNLLSTQTNLIIICDKIDKKTAELYAEYIVELPILEPWQIRDYVTSKLPMIKSEEADWLCSICNNDIFRVDLEVQRLLIFGAQDIPFMVYQFKQDGIYSDLVAGTTYDLVNAIIHKDKTNIIPLYKAFLESDSSPMGLVVLLYNAFKNIIRVQFTPNPTVENCGMTSQQLWIYKTYHINYYNRNQLHKIFTTLTDMQAWIRLEKITTDTILDFLLVTIFSIS